MTLMQEQQQPMIEGMQQVMPQNIPQPQNPNGGVPPLSQLDNPSAPRDQMPNGPVMPRLPPQAPAQAQAAYEQMTGAPQ
jgi:hypothetical protein